MREEIERVAGAGPVTAAQVAGLTVVQQVLSENPWTLIRARP